MGVCITKDELAFNRSNLKASGEYEGTNRAMMLWPWLYLLRKLNVRCKYEWEQYANPQSSNWWVNNQTTAQQPNFLKLVHWASFIVVLFFSKQ